MGSVSGQFVWFDLLTGRKEAAKAFYSEVIGWKTTAWSGTEYTMWTVGEHSVGGIMEMPEGAPPSWLGYAKVDDVDAACATARELGGHVHRDGTDIADVGRFAILADPQGVVFAVFTPQDDTPVLGGATAGAFSWAELNTTDYEGAWKFYSALFGWEHTADFEMGPDMGNYFMFTHQGGGKKSMGGMSNAATMTKAPPHWLFYVTVDDIDAAVERVRGHGGKVLNGPMDIPGEVPSRIAQCVDPEGAGFALYCEDRR